MTENYAHDTVVPYRHSELSKKNQVAEMFDDIAPRYDFLNHFLSAGIDKVWRRKAIAELKSLHPEDVLDIATGTGDVALMLNRILKPHRIVGIDISEGMLSVGKKKVSAQCAGNVIELLQGDSADIDFDDNSFDAATVAFGVRNFQRLEKGLTEILRVLKPGGKLVVLEFSHPRSAAVKFFYNLYMKVVAANVGKAVSKNDCAYKYLDESISKFPEGKDFLAILDKIGFTQTTNKTLTLGICSIYCGTK